MKNNNPSIALDHSTFNQGYARLNHWARLPRQSCRNHSTQFGLGLRHDLRLLWRLLKQRTQHSSTLQNNDQQLDRLQLSATDKKPTAIAISPSLTPNTSQNTSEVTLNYRARSSHVSSPSKTSQLLQDSVMAVMWAALLPSIMIIGSLAGL